MYRYPLVNVYITMENHHANTMLLMGKSTINGTFSIAMLVYQRVATDSHSEPQMSLLEYTSESPFGQLKFPNHIRIN